MKVKANVNIKFCNIKKGDLLEVKFNNEFTYEVVTFNRIITFPKKYFDIVKPVYLTKEEKHLLLELIEDRRLNPVEQINLFDDYMITDKLYELKETLERR